MDRYSTITIREGKQSKKLKISSDLKPEIIDSILEKWQSLLDTLTKIINVPAGLIMRLNEESIEVFLKSNTKGNPYAVGEKAKLIYGLYCESVIGTQKQLLVPDATKSEAWSINNPDIDINMISYLGLPLNWPDGECFGTVCVLDSKENHYSEVYKDLLSQIKQHIEIDLQLLLTNKELEQLNAIKTKFLSLISHDVRGNMSSADMLLKLIINSLGDIPNAKLNEMLFSVSQSLSQSYLTLENLLSWSKAEIVQMEPHKNELNIIDVFEELLQYFGQPIQLKELNLRKEFYSEEAIILADENMITVCLRNILSNAIKYTPSKGIITVRVEKLKDQHFIEIIDTGIGMSEDAVRKLFSYDTKHRKSGTRGESSSGIGLMLTKEFLDKHNAKVTVSSKINEGTRVGIVI